MPSSHAAMAVQIFLIVASFHIPPTTFPPSLPLSPPISRPCAPWLFTPSTRHTDVSLIQATGKARKWVLPFFQRVVEYASCSATVKADLRVRDENSLELCGTFYSLHLFVWIYSLPLLKLGLQEVLSLALCSVFKGNCRTVELPVSCWGDTESRRTFEWMKKKTLPVWFLFCSLHLLDFRVFEACEKCMFVL